MKYLKEGIRGHCVLMSTVLLPYPDEAIPLKVRGVFLDSVLIYMKQQVILKLSVSWHALVMVA